MKPNWSKTLIEKLDEWALGRSTEGLPARHAFMEGLLEFLFQASIIELRAEDCSACLGTGGNKGDCACCDATGWTQGLSGRVQTISASPTSFFKSAYRPDSDHWCSKHSCTKTWMLSSSFCSQCEQELHGDKGIVKPVTQIPAEEEEITLVDFQPNGFKIRDEWEAKYGQFLEIAKSDPLNFRVHTTSQLSDMTSWSILYNAGYPEIQLPTEWHDSIAKVWPI